MGRIGRVCREKLRPQPSIQGIAGGGFFVLQGIENFKITVLTCSGSKGNERVDFCGSCRVNPY